ncbi:KMO-like protein [Mya arenaria]|uniref:KMO-like protein n=1 Tax=Mya arenaria TaxID=6604 RepID=A0ABY7FCS5_MYAAR|nr:KMO-like protein [Mya arenaria]WAR18576.1 KMO-like protein [Mya arenaria]
MKSVIIVGGGLDIRDMEVVRGRSINLALSTRGREALRRVGLEDIVISTGIPMYARMIHDLDGTRRPIPYGKADQLPNVEMHFEHKIVACDFNAGRITFSKSDGSHVTAHADLVVGCDGAFSGVRQQMMKKTLFDYEQVFIPHGYMELCMEPAPGDKDKTYTCTLFMPFDIFKTLDTPEAVLAFFRDKFPDSLPLLGEKYVTETVSTSKALPLISVKCSPYHVKDRAVIMGDAAHAMVPFYGQGMNCGFEDCVVFDDILSKHNNDIAATLKEFTEVRSVDAKAMCDLAFYNYIEMRQSVNSRLFLLRKKLDNFLYWLFPNMWMPLYTSVSFSRTRYHQCIANKEWQDRLIRRALYMSVPAMAALGYCVATRTRLLDAPVSETIQQLVERLRPTWI